MSKKIYFFASILCFVLFSCKNDPTTASETTEAPVSNIPRLDYRVTGIIPHNTSFFTEGLLVYNGQFLESTGSPEEIPSLESVVATVNMESGKSEEKIKLDKSKYFGEGIVVIQDKLYQLTYKNQKGFIYDVKSFKKLGEFSYPSIEGWGMTTDGKHAIMSDGTDQLSFLLPPDMKVVKTVRVTEDGISVLNVNELEWVKGYIFANIWTTNDVIKIDPNTGKVVGKMDLSSLKNEANNTFQHSEVANGIAYDSISNKLYVTGKLWPSIYRLELIENKDANQ
ncbi:MAG: glutaminyl-peptide cyclotransferase [Bacteroidetes bacterium]|jgi:glutamine cyclotransferase|nr:glutaminyl-peptide cyclotransferase [Bacteroidota bacterium]HRG43832.1 glutaminyl-peptide cyclotransferase [Saprospiraceae bacterium]